MIGKFSTSNLPAVWFDGEYRVLGCIPSPEEEASKFPAWSNVKSAAGLQEIDLSWYKPPILNQGSTSSCVAHASCSGMEMCWLQSGKPLVEFNPFFVYSWINGGRDAGASVSSALTALQTHGICPKDDVPAGAMFQGQMPAQAIQDAKRFVLQDAYRCTTFDDICQAINVGFVIPLGILVGQNFGQLDSNGVAPLPNGGGGGHCLLGVGLKQSSQYGWLIKIQNSWGSRFGMSGYAYIHQGHFQYMPIDAFAIQTVSDDPQGTPGDDPVVSS
jgi:hypothetical protein